MTVFMLSRQISILQKLQNGSVLRTREQNQQLVSPLQIMRAVPTSTQHLKIPSQEAVVFLSQTKSFYLVHY